MKRAMLFWVVATDPELKALRRLRALVRKVRVGPYDLFHNSSEDEWVICGGIGANETAMSIGFLAAHFAHTPTKVFGNVGIAGARGAEVGQAFAVNKVTSAATGRSYYPGRMPQQGLNSMPCITVEHVETVYPHSALYEMEAFGFMTATRKLTPTDGVGLIKVVSDTPSEGVTRITKDLMYDLVLSAEAHVNTIADALRRIASTLEIRHKPPIHLAEALGTHRFSVTEQNRLEKALRRWVVLRPNESPLETLRAHGRSQAIGALEHILDNTPLRLSAYD